jgi:hypothetical protein
MSAKRTVPPTYRLSRFTVPVNPGLLLAVQIVRRQLQSGLEPALSDQEKEGGPVEREPVIACTRQSTPAVLQPAIAALRSYAQRTTERADLLDRLSYFMKWARC